MRRIIDLAFLAAVIGVGAYVAYTHQAEIRGAMHSAQVLVAPCEKPLTYSLGAIDKRFKIATSTVIADLAHAEAIWEKGAGKDLFSYALQGGDVTISLIYDERQAATDKLKGAGYAVGKSRASYDSLKAQYDTLAAQVRSEQTAYKQQVAAYQAHTDSYNAKVEMWNDRGGAPKAQFDELQAEKDRLAAEFDELKANEAQMNADIGTVNALATALNQLIVQLNINVTQYNQVGASAGGFEEGLYTIKAGVQTIAIYEYSNHVQLVRVLAHEMGHALGLDHVANVNAIMYKINSGDTLATTPADLTELARVCRTDATTE